MNRSCTPALAFALAAFILSHVAAHAATTNTIAGTANAYVLRSSASSDQSEAQTLATKRLDDSNSRVAYARFDLSSFLAGNSVVNLTSARLRLYSTGGAADTVKVYALQNTNLNGVSDGAWTGSLTWNNQPAKTASPNDIPNSATALPNANTTAQLGSQSFGSTAGEVSISLDLSTLQQLLLADTNQQITLLFHNTGGNIINWASLANTSGFLVPTLELVANDSAGPAALLTWDGTVNGNWDTNTANWKTNAPSPSTTFKQADEVTFDDSKSGTSTVNLTLPVTPGRMTISNSTVDYTFNGSGRISGVMGFTKAGSGMVTVSTSNDFSGAVVVFGGTLKAGNASALGLANGSTTVTNGATLDVNGVSLVSEPVRVSGAGVGGNGVIVNTGPQQTSALRNVTLIGDTTVGGPGRWDIRAAGTTSTSGCSLSTGGQPYKLIKAGANQFSLVAVAVDSALGDIEVRSGVFSAEVATSSLGNPAYTLSVSNGATLQFYQNSVVLRKNVLLAGGATVLNNSGANTFGGAFTLAGAAIFNLNSGTSLNLTNTIGGGGGLTKSGSGTLTLNGTNGYAGPTALNAGKLILRGQLTGGALTTAAGTTLAANGGNAGPATIAGSLLPGDINVIGTFSAAGLTLSSGANATFEIAGGANDALQVSGDLALNNNSLTVIPLGTLQTNVPYHLVNYTGTLSGTFNPSLNLDTNFSATLDYSTPGQINLLFSRVQTFGIPAFYPTGPGPTAIAPGADGKLVYTPDTNGDVIPDFSSAGYRGGGVPIPDNVPVITTLSPVGGNNQPQIQSAIDALEALPIGTNGFRGAVYLNPGVYPMSNGLSFSASGVVLRGAGSSTNGTVLRLLEGNTTFTISNPSGVSRTEVSGTRHNITTPYVPLGAKWFTVDSVSGWAVGDNVVIHRPSTATWLQALYPPGGKDSWVGAVNLDWERTIVAIEGNRVMLDAPLMQSLDLQYGTAYVYKFTFEGRTENVGIEDIRSDCTSGVDTNGNTSGALLTVTSVQNCWMRRCMNDKMQGHTVKVSGGKWCTFEDIVSYHNPLPGGHSGASIGINGFDFGAQGLLFHRFTTSDGGFEWCSWNVAAGPNVFLECDIPHGFAFSGPHMKWAVGTLYDAVFQHHGLSVLLNDGSHGWAGGNHMAWNVEAHGIEFDRPPTAHQWVHGALSTSSSLSSVRSGALPTEVVSWQSHIDPRSLYRAQLAERVGAQKTFAALGRPYGDNYFVLSPEIDNMVASPGQETNVPVVLSTVISYPDSATIPNPAGSVAVPAWPGSTVTFAVSGLPFGCSASFNSATLNNAGTNLLNLVVSNNAPPGVYPLVVQGNGSFANIRGGTSPLNSFALVNLIVGGNNSFSLSASPFGKTIVAGMSTDFTITVAGTNGFTGAVALSVTNLPPGLSASFSDPAVDAPGTSMLTLTASNTIAGGSYTLTVLGANGGQTAGATLNITVLSTALPFPWIDQDIGAPSAAGSGSHLSGVFTGKGSGADIWGTSDQFNYICQTQTGDFAITARVASQQNTDPWAKAGVMIRESTNANSAYVGVYVTPNSSHGVSLQYRAGTGASALDAVQVSGPTVPYWVRLVRSGNAFSGYYSADGVSWTQAGTNVTVATGATVNAGLAVCSHSTGVLNTSTFDNVSIDYPDFDVVAMPDALGVNGNASAVYTISLSNRFGFSGSVNLSMNGLPPGATASFSLPAISGAATSMLTVTTTNVTASDNYSLDILGTNGTLVSDAVVTLVVTNSIDTDADGVPDWWSQLYFGHATGSAIDLTRGGDDFDGDIMSNAAEYLCGTDPADATSYLHILSAVPQSGDELVTWSAVGGISYVLQSATNFGVPNSFIDVSPVVTPDDDGPASYIDPGAATNAGARFYRVRLGP